MSGTLVLSQIQYSEWTAGRIEAWRIKLEHLFIRVWSQKTSLFFALQIILVLNTEVWSIYASSTKSIDSQNKHSVLILNMKAQLFNLFLCTVWSAYIADILRSKASVLITIYLCSFIYIWSVPEQEDRNCWCRRCNIVWAKRCGETWRFSISALFLGVKYEIENALFLFSIPM